MTPPTPPGERAQVKKHRAGGLGSLRRLMVAHPRRALTVGLVAALLAGGTITAAESAQAATTGPGFTAAGSSYLMLYTLPDGSLAACLDPHVPAPLNSSTDAGFVSAYTSHGGGGSYPTNVDATMLGRVNFLMSKYASVPSAVSNVMGAALAVTVGREVNPAAWAAETNPWGLSYYRSYMTSSEFTQFSALAGQYKSEFEAFTPGPGIGSGHMTNHVDNNNYTGNITFDALSPSPQQGQLTLTNGKFADGSTVMSGTFTQGQVIPVTGVPPASPASFEISESYTGATLSGPANNVHLWTTPGQQGVAGIGQTTGGNFTMTNHDPFTRSTLFAPIVTTEASSVFVNAGDFPADTLTFATTNFTDPDSGQTVNNPWGTFADGTYYTLTAKGTWYGPFSSPITQSATAPSNALISGHSTVTTTEAQGPTGTYQAVSDTAAAESGYYTWVQSIKAADAPALTQRYMPADYSFTDDFGRTPEGQVSPSQVKFATQLSASTVGVGSSITDSITPTLSGGVWLQDGGARIPVTMTATSYWSATRPVQSPTAPAGAVIVGTSSMVLSGPAPVVSPALPVGYQAGFVTVQWSIAAANQPSQYQGYFTDFTDDWGVPAETVAVTGPTVTTHAESTGPGLVATDIATVTGLLPPQGADLTWTAYQRPAGSTVAVCTPATELFTPNSPIVVTAPGDYSSNGYITPAGFLGSIDWVQHLTVHGTSVSLSEGACGEAGETSLSGLPTVTTVPPTGLVTGTTATDVATVNGMVPPGQVLVFALYKKADADPTLVCAPGNQVGAVSAPVAVTGGVAKDARYVSPATGPLTAGNYGFVETLQDATTGAVLVTGGCLDELFTVSVKPPVVIAATGTNGSLAWAAGGIGAGGIFLGLVLLLNTKRRKATLADAPRRHTHKA